MNRSLAALIALVAALAGACAPKVAPPAVPGAPKFPDYVFPAPPDRVGDARARARLDEGWQRLQAGDLRGAEAVFAQLAGQQPAFFPASVGLGYALLAQGRPKDALARFDAAVKQRPRYGAALAGRAEALLAAGQRDAAIGAFEAALAADASLADLRRRIDALKLDRFQDRIAAARIGAISRSPSPDMTARPRSVNSPRMATAMQRRSNSRIRSSMSLSSRFKASRSVTNASAAS
jgi:tetratricopeptide (TPR) repeat protein